MENELKNEFNNFIESYSKILESYWPSHDREIRFGFTEINLTVNFINSYLLSNPGSIYWYEVELPTRGKKSQRVDGAIFDKANKRIILIESKRLAKKDLFEAAKNDLARITNKGNIKYILDNYKFGDEIKECYSMVLADICVDRNKDRIVEKFYNNINNEFDVDVIFNTKINHEKFIEEFHVVACIKKINL